jgi:DNA repair photolyase
MKRWGPQKPLHLDEKDLETNLGEGNFIFVCHTCDMFAADVPTEWIIKVLVNCRYYDNKYLFQSKNPERFAAFENRFPLNVILGTTIETNRDIVKSKAPSVLERANAMEGLSVFGFSTMVTIEPIFDFDLEELVDLIVLTNPEWVNIGADSKGHGLPEPPAEKVRSLIDRLRKYTDIKLKGNLRRIIK